MYVGYLYQICMGYPIPYIHWKRLGYRYQIYVAYPIQPISDGVALNLEIISKALSI